jgi:anti-sigma-K factor RskA
MTTEQARAYCHAYLDGQLNAETKSAIDRLIASDSAVAQYYEEQQQFLTLVKKRTQDVASPENLEAGIRARLQASRSKRAVVVPISQAKPATRRNWMKYAAGLVLTLGTGAALFWTLHGECPYMMACVDEHRLVLTGKGAFEAKTSDAVKLAQWVGGEVQTNLKELPSGKEFKLALEGAGRVEFKSLQQWGSPSGVFVSYEGADNTRVTLLVHRWPEEEPEGFNRIDYKGKSYWATNHKGFGIASWKSPDDKLVITVVSEKSKTGTLAIAESMRAMIDAQIASNKVAFVGDRVPAQD